MRADSRLAKGLELLPQFSVLALQRPSAFPLGYQIRRQGPHSADYVAHLSHWRLRISSAHDSANTVSIPIVGVCPRPATAIGASHEERSRWLKHVSNRANGL